MTRSIRSHAGWSGGLAIEKFPDTPSAVEKSGEIASLLIMP